MRPRALKTSSNNVSRALRSLMMASWARALIDFRSSQQQRAAARDFVGLRGGARLRHNRMRNHELNLAFLMRA